MGKMRTKSGFTMSEVIVAIIIIGVLAALAVPSYRIQMLRVKNQEAIRILTAVWEAQKDYYRDNGAYATVIGQLAIDIPAPKNFVNLEISIAALVCTGPNETYLARIDSSDLTYELYALEDGRIVCHQLAEACPGSLCRKMGFPDW